MKYKQLIAGPAFLLILLMHSPLALAGSGGHHHHKLREVSDWSRAPSVSVDVKQDKVSGWNIHIQTKHFKFAPEKVNQLHQRGEGHLHLYVDDKKVARLYGPWFHLGSLEEGKHRIRVEMNGNDHQPWSIHGQKISAEVEVVQK